MQAKADAPEKKEQHQVGVIRATWVMNQNNHVASLRGCVPRFDNCWTFIDYLDHPFQKSADDDLHSHLFLLFHITNKVISTFFPANFGTDVSSSHYRVPAKITPAMIDAIIPAILLKKFIMLPSRE